MTVRVYYSNDAGAPTLNVSAGSLISVLDACLVNGYGSKAAAGWAKSFSGTNLAAYRPPLGNRFYLRIDDTVGASARAVGYESMTDVNTGTGLFPTAAQLSGGLYVAKANSTGTRPWVLVATERIFYFFQEPLTSSSVPLSSSCAPFCFGDITSYKAGDAFHTIIIGWESATNPDRSSRFHNLATISTANPAHFLARSYTQTGASITTGKMISRARMNDAGILGIPNNVTLIYPNPVTGSFDIEPVLIHEPAQAVVRGVLPGIWNPLHSTAYYAIGDTFSGTGELAGKTFLIVAPTDNSSAGRVAVEISDTW